MRAFFIGWGIDPPPQTRGGAGCSAAMAFFCRGREEDGANGGRLAADYQKTENAISGLLLAAAGVRVSFPPMHATPDRPAAASRPFAGPGIILCSGAGGNGREGFTLLELLAAIAIISILAGLLLPSLGAARTSALKARTRLQFGQWIAAMEEYREEYGCYPAVGTDGRLATAADTLRFVRTLTGSNPDGSTVAEGVDLNGNLKRRCFCQFSPADFVDPDRPGEAVDYSGNELLCDAFGNTEIAVLVDRNGDGFIRPADDGPLVSVCGPSGRGLVPDAAALPVAGVRSGVVFYSAGRGENAQDLILSWK